MPLDCAQNEPLGRLGINKRGKLSRPFRAFETIKPDSPSTSPTPGTPLPPHLI
jgi:hypothetical protein